MARARGGASASLIDHLRREPYRFDSRQALRIVEALQRKGDVAPVVFRSSLSLSFPLGDIESVACSGEIPPSEGAGPTVVTITVSFLGLGGATGPLPTPYTEYLAAAARRRETAGRDFLDLFNHRLVTAAMDLAKLFRPVLQPGLPHESNLARQSYALLGLGTPAIFRAIPAGLAPRLLPLTALVNERPRSAHAIERAVSASFAVPARVVPFRGDWLRVPAEQRSAIGAHGRNRRLGHDAMLGGRLWEQDAGITLELGPMTAAAAERLLPAAPGRSSEHATLRALLDFLLEGALGVEIRLLVRTDSIGASVVSRSRVLRLGWTAWLTRDGRTSRDPPRLGRSARLGGDRLNAPRQPEIAVVVLRGRSARA